MNVVSGVQRSNCGVFVGIVDGCDIDFAATLKERQISWPTPNFSRDISEDLKLHDDALAVTGAKGNAVIKHELLDKGLNYEARASADTGVQIKWPNRMTGIGAPRLVRGMIEARPCHLPPRASRL